LLLLIKIASDDSDSLVFHMNLVPADQGFMHG